MKDILAKTQWSLERASTFAGPYDILYSVAVGIAVFFTVLIFIAVVFLSVRYRRRAHAEPEEVHGHTGLEIFWSLVPLVIVVALFFWGAFLFYGAYRAPANAMEIYAVGKQWMWKFQHPTGIREINHLHVPLGKPVKVILTSEDVIHSFYVPAFRVKMDAVPGRYTSTWFEATEAGKYHLFCAEYCGTEHSLMTGKVIAMAPQDYEAWAGRAAEAAEPTAAERGEILFEKFGCVKCHGVGAALDLGPRLEGNFGRMAVLNDTTSVLVDEAYVRESILEPTKKVLRGFPPVMPSYKDLLSEEEILEIIAYIKALGAEERQ